MTEWRELPISERIALVQAHHAPERSAAQIAASIGMGISRNVVVGVYDRYPSMRVTHPLGGNIGHVAGGKRKAAEPMRRHVERRTDKPKPAPLARIVRPEFRGVDLMGLGSHECKWPAGDRDFTFCGAPADGPYCAYHARLARPIP